MHTTRRQFLAMTVGSSAIVSLGAGFPRFLVQAAAAQDSADKPAADETILVVIQLTGGNDGLNTVIPFTDERYYQARPTLAVPRGQVLKIDDQVGLHPSLRPCSDLLEAGRLAVVQGVGYPQPNRSHFESMDIWHTCQRKTDLRSDGWLGRYLEQLTDARSADVPALHLGGDKQPLALAARDVRVPSIRSLDRFRLQAGDQHVRAAMQRWGDGQRSPGNDLLGFVQTSTTSALQVSQRIEEARGSYQAAVSYPEHELGQNLQTIAQLIDARLGARIYYVELDGFDTHSQQAPAHTALLDQLSGALAAFVNDITMHGHAERVLVMTFSEFGRRVKENASKGTDHGAAAPMLLAGGRVRAGLLGSHPSLTDLDDGDLKHHTDFRQVYATVLEQWLGWPSEPVLGSRYETLELMS